MFVFSVIVVSCAFAKLGPLPGVFSLITLGLIYFGLLGLSIYKPINKDHLSPITDYEQATKTCKPPYTEKPKGWLEMIGLKGGGKNITKQLKDIHKKFTKSNSNM
jgi:hypothetical protein